MAMPGNRDTIVGHRRVTFDDQIRFDIRVLGTRYLITLTRDKTAIETHPRRSRNNLAAVIGIVTYTNKIHHY